MDCVPVIILNYNSSADCANCVQSLEAQQGVELEVVIVDNASEAADRASVEALCAEHGCTFLAAEANRGYNAGNNIGLRYAAGKGYEYALIANPDMIFPQKDYVYKLLETMQQDKNIAVCGSDIMTPNGVHQSPMKRDGNWRTTFGWVKGLMRKPKADTYDFIDDHKTTHYCSKVSGCCLMVRMSFVKEIGFFDEYPFLYCEEAILSRQVEHTGLWRMYYTANLQAIHNHVKSEKGDPIPRFRQWLRSRLYYIDRYSGDHAFGKMMAKISMRLNVFVITTGFRMKKILHRMKKQRQCYRF